MSIDYRELLMKYISHVGYEEGITYISVNRRGLHFTNEEWAELQRLDEESKKYKDL